MMVAMISQNSEIKQTDFSSAHKSDQKFFFQKNCSIESQILVVLIPEPIFFYSNKI